LEPTKEENAMRTYVIGAALLLSLTAPALAEEFYIVQNPTTKKCTIVTEKPTTTTTTTVVGGTTYTTRTEAENVLKKTTVRGGSVCLNSSVRWAKWSPAGFQAAAACGSRVK